jgi:hypothetical protein
MRWDMTAPMLYVADKAGKGEDSKQTIYLNPLHDRNKKQMNEKKKQMKNTKLG